MDLIKIGNFIAECRKRKKLTQEQLAEKLGITYKAVSKWECGKGLPDVSTMKELCEILNISLNELFSGELLDTETYIKKAEQNFTILTKEKESNIKATRLGFGFTLIFLVIITMYNIIKYGASEAFDKSEFLFMIIITLIYNISYLYCCKKNK
ncbi:MAG: helix-turn-helix transcriptional regulator [bacterium]|nr:helix-turn-helix transcriptional regulator [bacterium]